MGLTSLATAQETANSLFTASVGAGFTTPVYHAGSQLDTGWNVQGQAGINLFGARAGLVGEFDYNHMGVNSATLTNLQFPGGETNIWSVSADPVLRFNPNGKVSVYLIGGPGVYHRTIDFTQPTVAFFNGFDPFLGVIYPVGVPANQVVASYSTTKLGVNGGVGFNYRIGSGHAKFFAEARYNQMYTQHTMAWVPVTFGFRW
jgi:hypothetical protein